MNRIAPQTAPQRQGLRDAVAIVGVALLLFGAMEVGLEWREMTDATGSRIGSGSAPTPAAPSISLSPVFVLTLPSPTATNTPRPAATATQDPVGKVDFCTSNDPGTLCRVPFPTPPPPTPYPDCANMATLDPGDWCVWPDGSPVADQDDLRRGGPTATPINFYPGY